MAKIGASPSLGRNRLKFFCRQQFRTASQPFVLDAGQKNRAKPGIADDMVRDVPDSRKRMDSQRQDSPAPTESRSPSPRPPVTRCKNRVRSRPQFRPERQFSKIFPRSPRRALQPWKIRGAPEFFFAGDHHGSALGRVLDHQTLHQTISLRSASENRKENFHRVRRQTIWKFVAPLNRANAARPQILVKPDLIQFPFFAEAIEIHMKKRKPASSDIHGEW